MRILKSLIIGSILVAVLGTTGAVYAAEPAEKDDSIVKINKTNYKDQDLYNYILSLDTNKNQVLSKTELRGHIGWVELKNKHFYITAEGLPIRGYYKGPNYNYYFNNKGVMQTEWVNYNNQKLYFSPNTGRQEFNKWVTYKNNRYFIDAKGHIKKGWLDYNGSRYYLKSDSKQAKMWYQIGNYKYYFTPGTGKLLTDHWVNYKNTWYHVDSKGRMQKNAWIKHKGYRYRVNSQGKMIKSKKVKINSKYFYLNKNGKMVSGKVITVGKKLYYASKSGAIITKKGWYKENGKVYLVGDNGVLTINKLAKYNGKYYYMRPSGKGELLRNQAAARVADSLGCNLAAAMKYAGGLTYSGRNTFTDSWGTYKLANYGISNHSGNCYVYAAVFTELAYAMGYDAHQVRGSIRLSWGWGNNHSWVEIKKGGKTYVCDPAGLHQLGWNNAYMFQYGQKGTWMYKDQYEIVY